MGFKKYKADQLFTGYAFLNEEQVLITDEKGTILDIVSKQEAGDDILEMNGILTPGFINCHCHLELSHMKGMISEATGLVKFILSVVQQRHVPEEQVLQAIEKAENEMLANGIVAVGDICNNALSLVQKTKGRMYYHNFIEASGFNPAIAEERFQRSVEFFKAYAQFYSVPAASNSIVPHAPYSVADNLWELIINFPGNQLMTIHNQEAEDENEWFINKKGSFHDLYEQMKIDSAHFNSTGKSSLRSYLDKFLHNQAVILVHNVHTTANDISYSQQSRIKDQLYWCLCPNANLYISGNLPPVDLLREHHCQIVLGTDSLASNHQLSILEEMRAIRKKFQTPLDILLQWATANGAKALQLDTIFGSFEKGKMPGVVCVDHELTKAKRLI
jgi:cytosine/adenosine deaminase-related metal-dependent hydrolase